MSEGYSEIVDEPEYNPKRGCDGHDKGKDAICRKKTYKTLHNVNFCKEHLKEHEDD